MFQRPVQWICCGAVALCCISCHNAPPSSNPLSKRWYEFLPHCPCENPDKNGIKLSDGWAKDQGNLRKYHPGATESFRSYPAVSTSEGMSGQQCCYDAEGHLITGGSAAGTPDKISTCDGEDANGVMITRYRSLLSHYVKDVKPWETFGGSDNGWVYYNLLWVPDNGNACKTNIITK